MFAVSGVTFHELGLLDAVIAIPWVLQIGYIFALLIQLNCCFSEGSGNALGTFLVTIPAGMIFFVFHLRARKRIFSQGLLFEKVATQARAVCLDLTALASQRSTKRYAESHFMEALLILAALIVYGAYSVILWCVPPALLGYHSHRGIMVLGAFAVNPSPTMLDLQKDAKDIVDWVNNQQTKGTSNTTNELRYIHKLREQTLLTRMHDKVRRVSGHKG